MSVKEICACSSYNCQAFSIQYKMSVKRYVPGDVIAVKVFPLNTNFAGVS